MGEPRGLGVCHCKECQRHSGSAFGMSLFVQQDDFVVERGELKCFERSSESGRPLRCYFCSECGIRIYTVPTYVQGIVNVKPGTLDDTSGLKPNVHVWLRSRQLWVEVPGDVPTFDTQPEKPRSPS